MADYPHWSRKQGTGNNRAHQPVIPPKALKAFPQAAKVTPKTPRASGGGRWARWQEPKGQIFEWDYQHGRVEVYDAHGNHLGEYDPDTGHRTNSNAKGDAMTIAHKLIGYDRASELVAAEFDMPQQKFDLVKRIAGVAYDDQDAIGAYSINAPAAQEIGREIGLELDTTRYDFFLGPVA